MKTIINVTENAVRRLEELLGRRADVPGQCLRLVAAPGGAGLLLDTPRREDAVIVAHGAPLLLIAPLLTPVLEGATLDCPGDSEEGELVLTK
jgi:hypothetical protein